MSSMVFDETGARYYETGVSKGIFFDMQGNGVPWNGLVSVSLDPSGGDYQPYYYDGVKYMERILAEDFQATVQAINTPKEFEACEGVRTVQFGMKTHFNKRDKFNLVWRTEIGSDEGEQVGYKLHIAYNCLVQPSARAYATLADSATMDVRSFVITATPACGRNSYFSFDSRDGDLSALEDELYSGNLPKCYELAGLMAAPAGGGGGSPSDPDLGCPSLLVDFEKYVAGSVVDDDDVSVTNTEAFVHGVINNGIDFAELPAAGAYAANDSAASEVGTHPVLVDGDDATYITSADGDLGYTVALPPLVGYVEGCRFELHIRMSISGDISEDDPDNLDADAQVHISTDAGGDDTIGGFSDGTDEGMGFALTVVDGTPVDYVVPLFMDAWVDTGIADVVAALETGAYLNVVGASNNNPDTTPEVRVYEASVVMINDVYPEKFLRAADPTGYGQYGLNIYDDSSDYIDLPVTNYVDFKVSQVAQSDDADGDNVKVIFQEDESTDYAAELRVAYDEADDIVQVSWFWDDSGASLWDATVLIDKWYRVTWDWYFDTWTIKVAEKASGVVLHTTTGDATDHAPWSQFTGYAGFTGNDEKTYEVVVDNAKMQIHCNYEAPAGGDPIVIDVPVTRARLVRHSTSLGDLTDEFVDLPADGPVLFDYNFGGSPGDCDNYLYIVELDGEAGATEDYFPTTPSGYELVDVRPYIEATISSSQTSFPDGPTGYHPEPTLQPFLVMNSTWGMTYDGPFDGSRHAWGAADDLTLFVPGGGGAGADSLHKEADWGGTKNISVANYGYRFTYNAL